MFSSVGFDINSQLAIFSNLIFSLQSLKKRSFILRSLGIRSVSFLMLAAR
jgi:hypothetical protein